MKNPKTHFRGDLIPPWSSAGLWRDANQSMASAIHCHRNRWQDAIYLAQQIRCRIEALDPLMRALCEQTCPLCTDNCCRRATVWFDFKDLLLHHMVQKAVPTGQLITAVHQTCRYLGFDGCTLPRIQRPFVCTWFICSSQKGVLDHWPLSRKQFLWNSLEALKNGRNKLENLFIRVVTL